MHEKLTLSTVDKIIIQDYQKNKNKNKKLTPWKKLLKSNVGLKYKNYILTW